MRRTLGGIVALLTLIVLPAPHATAHDEASTSTSTYASTRDDLLRVMVAEGPRAALLDLDRRSRREPGVAAVCHAIAHDLGHAALEAARGRVARVLDDRDDVCGGGFTHGVIEMALGASTHPERDLLTICAPSQDGSCFHGVGHGLMFATGMDVERSLALCDRAPDRHLAVRCGEGVFMQRFSGDAAAGHTVNAPAGVRAPSLTTASATCTRTRGAYASTCWFYAPTLWLAARTDDFVGALRWCEARPGAVAKAACTKGVGSRTIKFHPDDPRIGAAACRRADDVDSCLQGMGSYWSVHWRGRRPAGDVCHRLGDADLARRCRAVT